jgi:hypothetical protein
MPTYFVNLFAYCGSISTLTPLILSGILFGANSPTTDAPAIPYIDCLFLCVSAMTVCGLATVDLSRLTGFQQALLFAQSCVGSPVSSFSCGFLSRPWVLLSREESNTTRLSDAGKRARYRPLSPHRGEVVPMQRKYKNNSAVVSAKHVRESRRSTYGVIAVTIYLSDPQTRVAARRGSQLAELPGRATVGLSVRDTDMRSLFIGRGRLVYGLHSQASHVGPNEIVAYLSIALFLSFS